MTQAEAFFMELMTEVPDVVPGKMFGALCMKTPNGKSPAMFWKDNLVVKLQGELHAEALCLDGSCLFDPMEGRPMKEWVQIPFDYKDRWREFVLSAAENVARIEKKPAKKK
ncbi:MAG: hypothetical protein KGZ82_08010 [Bacteroidales bacterium]|nr:hypothetical protein [Bacteroidales bacterium]